MHNSQWLLGNLNGSSRLILLSQRSFSKTAGENWLYEFFEQAVITWVHWSWCVTLKALVLIFKTLKLLGRAHARGPKPKQFSWNHGIAKRTAEVYRVKALSTTVTELWYSLLMDFGGEGASEPSRKERTWETFLSVHATPTCYVGWMLWKETEQKKRSTKFP